MKFVRKREHVQAAMEHFPGEPIIVRSPNSSVGLLFRPGGDVPTTVPVKKTDERVVYFEPEG